MKIGIDIDGTLNKFPKFFVELGRMVRSHGGEVSIITGLGHNSAVERLQKVVNEYGDGFYDRLVDTSLYSQWERAMIGVEKDNEVIVGYFKQRICQELGVEIMFDDQAATHRRCGDIPIFEVQGKENCR